MSFVHRRVEVPTGSPDFLIIFCFHFYRLLPHYGGVIAVPHQRGLFFSSNECHPSLSGHRSPNQGQGVRHAYLYGVRGAVGRRRGIGDRGSAGGNIGRHRGVRGWEAVSGDERGGPWGMSGRTDRRSFRPITVFSPFLPHLHLFHPFLSLNCLRFLGIHHDEERNRASKEKTTVLSSKGNIGYPVLLAQSRKRLRATEFCFYGDRGGGRRGNYLPTCTTTSHAQKRKIKQHFTSEYESLLGSNFGL